MKMSFKQSEENRDYQDQYGSCNFVVFEKFTCADLHQLAHEIMSLPKQRVKEPSEMT